MNDNRHILKREFRLPFSKNIEHLIQSLSLTGKAAFYILTAIFILSGLSLLWQLNKAYLVTVPQPGGTLTEGVIGTSRFINPLLATTNGDKDLTALVYSGLMRHMPDDSLIPDLAESYTISSSGLTYTFVLKKNLTFQDGYPVTSDDVVFTIQKAQDPEIKSNKQANWEGITIEKVDDRTVKFTMKQPYAPFLQNMTLGILPKHLWGAISNTDFSTHALNSNPIGTGPYKIVNISKNKDNIPTAYTLNAFDSFALGKPFISTVVIRLYASEKNLTDAYSNGEIDAINSISPESAEALAKKGAVVDYSPLPRVFGVFFNQSENTALAQHEVRQALDLATNRNYIVNSVLRGYGTVLTSPVPQSFIDGSEPNTQVSDQEIAANIVRANTILDVQGWKINKAGIREKKFATGSTTLSFSISTSDSPELKAVADILKTEWQKIGVDVSIKIFEGGYLNQNIIRPRKYDALLFGQVINRDLDLFAFWHSSQRTDPGLNISLYSNKQVDTTLEQLRVTSDRATRQIEYKKFSQEIAKDIPALFLYAPDFIYIPSRSVKNFSISRISVPSERFGDIVHWYINTDSIWKMFLGKSNTQ